MPFVALERPSLALGLLQSSANKTGVSARSEYPTFEYAELIGAEFYSRLLHCAPDQNIGDWLFAGAAFPDQRERHCAFVEALDQELVASWLWLPPDTLEAELWRARACAEALVAKLARQIADSGARIVGCSSVFEQHVASLALLRAVKACNPSIQTMLGGANCEAEMGQATHRSFEWVDYVVSGEADLFFGDLCHDILYAQVSNTDLRHLPVGTLGPLHRRAPDCVTPGALARARVN
jgi:magnesium-protoporphyrin IX monomethyl ester (oxidative) cyclase